MHARKFLALPGHAWPAQLAHAVVLGAEEALAPHFVHLLPHGLCHALAAEKADMYV